MVQNAFSLHIMHFRNFPIFPSDISDIGEFTFVKTSRYFLSDLSMVIFAFLEKLLFPN